MKQSYSKSVSLRKAYIYLFLFILGQTTYAQTTDADRKRVREYGIHPGILTPGKWNNITDVDGVSVGHTSVTENDSVRTGVTVIKPHGGNIFQQKSLQHYLLEMALERS